MAKRNRSVNSEIMQKWKERQGQGEFSEYKPWPLIGMPSHITCVISTITLVHYRLSDLALDYLSILDRAKSISDIQKQVPLLPRKETMMIAETLNIRHPCHPKTREYTILTTDFLMVLRRPDGSFVDVAIEVRPTWALDFEAHTGNVRDPTTILADPKCCLEGFY